MKAADLFDVHGLAVLITGGAGGLGQAFAEALVDNGARVRLLDRDQPRLDDALVRLRDKGGTVEGAIVELTDRAALRAEIDRAAAEMGRLDVVFANAGIEAGAGFLAKEGGRDPAGALENIDDALWDRVIAINLTAVATTFQAAAVHMKRQGSGRLIATSSIASNRPGGIVGTPYGISKAGVNRLVQQAALELARYGVTVNAILPGPFLTSLTTPELEVLFRRGSPMHRVAATDEIQGLALLLASPAARYITGAQMVVDGGSMLGRAD